MIHKGLSGYLRDERVQRLLRQIMSLCRSIQDVCAADMPRDIDVFPIASAVY